MECNQSGTFIGLTEIQLKMDKFVHQRQRLKKLQLEWKNTAGLQLEKFTPPLKISSRNISSHPHKTG